MTNSDIFEVKKHKALKPKTRNAKATGLKSTFVIEDSVLMTTFGKGNDAIIEKEINSAGIKSINPENKIEVSRFKKHYGVKGNGRHTSAYTTTDSVNSVGQDLIGCKDVLEQRYFGRTFNDNIHIQLIYNILDIEKILTVHINDIVYSLDNLQRKDGFETDDFIGYMSTKNSYDVFCNPETAHSDNPDLCKKIRKLYSCFEEYKKNPRLAYFDCISYDKRRFVDEKKLYYILAILGEIRQFCAHSKNLDALYNLEKELHPEAKQILDEMYKSKIDSINNGFVKNNAKNITILFDVYSLLGVVEKETLIKNFYEFTIRKSFKNLGFSIKKLREQMLDSFATDIKSNNYDSVRSKLYTLLDFIIYTYYQNHSGYIESNLNTLRACASDEEKESFYEKESRRLWSELQPMVANLKRKVNGKFIKDLKPAYSNVELMKKVTEQIALKKDADYFCKAIYLMTRFMDGKEINILLTTLINKFENIASFTDVMDKMNIPYNFKGNSENNFTLFANAKRVALDLRAINSFARMSNVSQDAKRILFIEAAKLLGVSLDENELVDYLQENMLGEHIRKGEHGFRNFIASNVIESSRFRYLARYANPEKVRAVANNKSIVKFVLSKMPATQIERYYSACVKDGNTDTKIQIEKLTDIISSMSFEKFKNAKMKVWRNSPEESEKMQSQAIISLYLTVLFLLVKNLVYVNSRYFIAFHCCERDARLHKIKGTNENWCALTSKHVSDKLAETTEWFNSLENPSRNQSKRKWRIERACSYLETNMSNIDNITITVYRNNIDHLNPIRNINMFIDEDIAFSSYFELYHYLMQCSIEQSSKCFNVSLNHPRVLQYLSAVKQHRTYCKDFVKALNAPFGYNLPRFKNLSIDALFDMHNPPVVNNDENKE